MNWSEEPTGQLLLPGMGVLRSQGTESVPGTWSSEGEAGRHDRTRTKPSGTPSPEPVESRLERIAQQAREYPEMIFTTLAHHLDVPMLEHAYQRLNPYSAPGIDRVTWQSYKRDLDNNLARLHEKLVEGTYTPQPVKRSWIPKSNGKQRPLGLPILEDQIVARAVSLILERIYEQDFKDFSYGFRERRSCHQALRDLRNGLLRQINYVIDCDISAFFDNLEHNWLLRILRQRINDGRLLKLIEMWLKTGIMEGKELVFPEKGSPQGSVISPLLANIYLHEVLDKWFDEVVRIHCRGKVVLYRYADDFVIGCERKEDVDRIMKVLPKRFAKYGLQINEDKTKVVKFGRPEGKDPRRRKGPEARTFTFLGFVHYWGKTWKGGYTIKRKTEGRRMSRRVREMWQWCRKNRHNALEEQHARLSAKLRGYYQYFGVRCNYEALSWVYYKTERAWKYWLNRRGGRKKLTWKVFGRLKETMPLPKPRITQSWV